MSTKTIKQRIALVAATALTAGFLSVVSAPASFAANNEPPGGASPDGVANTLNIATTTNTSGVDLSVTNSCRDKTPQGNFINATGSLVNERTPGWYEEEFIPGLPTVNYTIIAIGDTYSVEFDCGELFGVVNYCIHILSRTPTMDSVLLSNLISFANNTLDLNI
jgi:apolipoprotein D and lipocalin family protein